MWVPHRSQSVDFWPAFAPFLYGGNKMAKKLSQNEIKDIPNWSGEKLLDQLEYFSDYKNLIDAQNASGIANKSTADKDVRKLHNDYDVIKTEIFKRLQSVNDREALAQMEDYSNAIALHSARGALGIPDDGKTENDMQTIKNNYNTNRMEIISKLEN